MRQRVNAPRNAGPRWELEAAERCIEDAEGQIADAKRAIAAAKAEPHSSRPLNEAFEDAHWAGQYLNDAAELLERLRDREANARKVN